MEDLYQRIKGQVQFGPVYRCFVCGKPVIQLRPYHSLIQPPTDMDRYADHYAYLETPVTCTRAHHPVRVAVVGPAITPVDWPDRAPVEVKEAAFEEALALLTEALQEQDEHSVFDPVLSVLSALHARAITPAEAQRRLASLPSASFLVPQPVEMAEVREQML
jgi:hypothetical protein